MGTEIPDVIVDDSDKHEQTKIHEFMQDRETYHFTIKEGDENTGLQGVATLQEKISQAQYESGLKGNVILGLKNAVKALGETPGGLEYDSATETLSISFGKPLEVKAPQGE